MAAQVQGITSIRAYGAENKVRLETQTRIDKYVTFVMTALHWLTIVFTPGTLELRTASISSIDGSLFVWTSSVPSLVHLWQLS